MGFGCGRLFEFEWKGEGGERLLTCSSFRMGAYSTWALIRLGAYSNKYGSCSIEFRFIWIHLIDAHVIGLPQG